MSQSEFARWLGRGVVEWAHIRAGRRAVPVALVRTARRRAQDAGGGWSSRLDVAIQDDALARVA